MIDPAMQSLVDEGNKLMTNYIVIRNTPERTKPADNSGKPDGNVTGVTVKAGEKFVSDSVVRGWVQWKPNRWILEADVMFGQEAPPPDEPEKPFAIIFEDGKSTIYDMVERSQ